MAKDEKFEEDLSVLLAKLTKECSETAKKKLIDLRDRLI